MIKRNTGRVLLNLVDCSLADLRVKGNLCHADELYNPLDYFERVHHVSFWAEDRAVSLQNPSILIHVLNLSLSARRPRRFYAGLPTDVVRALTQLLQICRRSQVDVIRGRNAFSASLFGLMASRILGVPFVISLGAETNRMANEQLGAWPVMNSRWLSCRVEETVLRGANRVLVPNETVRQYVLRLRVRPDRIRLVPLRVRPEFFTPAAADPDFLRRYGLDPQAPVVLYVGRLDLDKDVLSLFDAIGLIHQRHPATQFVFLGDGPNRQRIEERLAREPWRGRTFLLGFQPTPVVRSFLSVATVVWIPKAGFALMEAAAAGATVVAYDIEWQRELIVDRENGRLVPYLDTRHLADAVCDLLEHPREAAQLRTRLTQGMAEQFHPRQVAAREMHVYQELLGAA